MKILIQYIICCLLIINCNGQTSNNPLPYQDELYNKYVPIMKNLMDKQGYKYPDQNTFETKILDYFGENIRDSIHNDVYLEKGKGFYALKNEKFIDTYQLDRGKIDGTGDAFESILKEGFQNEYNKIFVLYNKILFNDDIFSITQILHDKESVEGLVVYLDYEKSSVLMNFASKNVNYESNKENFQYLKHVIFYNNRNRKPVVRKELLSMIFNFNPEIVKSLAYSVLYDHARYTEITQNNKDEALAYMLNIVLQKDNPIEDFQNNEAYRLLNNCYVEDISILERFKKNKFYDYKYLEEYTKIFLLSKENSTESLTYIIHDNDGYTNLRKDKNSSSQIIQKINTGEQIDVLDQSRDWWLVISKEGKKGYVHKSRITSK